MICYINSKHILFRNRKRSASVQWRPPRHQLSHSLSSISLDELDTNTPAQQRRTPSEAHPLGGSALKPTPVKPLDMSPALIAQTNWNFVEKLLKVTVIINFLNYLLI